MSWTAIIRNTCVEDDPVLRVIPYFADDDREGIASALSATAVLRGTLVLTRSILLPGIDITLYDIDATQVSDGPPYA